MAGLGSIGFALIFQLRGTKLITIGLGGALAWFIFLIGRMRGNAMIGLFLAVTVAAMVYALYQLFGDDLFTFISVLLLVGCCFGAGMVLGFMATIYVSGERVYAPLYGILLAVTLFGICRQRSVWKEPAAVSSAVFLTALTVVCCAVNVLFIVLSL